MRQLEPFTWSYINTALELGADNGAPLELVDLHPSAMAAMRADCAAFVAAHGIPTYDRVSAFTDAELAGQDFWLTRNGHGAGFWDGDLPEDVGRQMTDAAHAFGPCDLYVGDDGLIYLSRG